MSDVKHTPSPYSIGPEWENDTSVRLFAGSLYLGAIWNTDESPEQSKANAEHIVKCVNSHDALVKALQSYRDAYDIDNRDRENIDMVKWCVIQDEADKALRDAGISESEVPK